MSQLPHLTVIAEELASDNYGTMAVANPYLAVLWSMPLASVAPLEEQAARLSNDEKLTFAAGEHNETLEIVATHNVQLLHDFVGDLFDGQQGWMTKYLVPAAG